MKKIKNEKELVKKAILLGMSYAEKRGVAKFKLRTPLPKK